MKIKVIVVEPGKSAYLKEIEHDLKAMQEIVGGYIQAVCPYARKVALVCNEDGKAEGLPPNRLIGEIWAIIAGTFFLCRLGDTGFESLEESDIEYFLERFKNPSIHNF